MLAMMLTFGVESEPATGSHLTEYGRFLYNPERELALFVVGCALSAGLAWSLAWATRLRAMNLQPSAEANRFLARNAAIQVALWFIVVLSLPVTLGPGWWLMTRVGAPRAAELALLAGPALIAWLLAVQTLRRGGDRPEHPPWNKAISLVRRMARELEQGGCPSDLEVPHPVIETKIPPWGVPLADLAVVGLIVAVVYVPAWKQLAADLICFDMMPHYHWNYFAMGPAVGFRAGGALGTDVFSQYGLGWPTIFATLDPVLPLSYANALGISVTYACLYFLGIYILLRLIVRSVPWSATGLVAVIYFQLFQFVVPGATIWLRPNTTLLRNPLDIWFFISLVLHLRSSRASWLMLASILAGLSIVFETDTGIFLVATLVLYGVGRRVVAPIGTFGSSRPVCSTALASMAMLGALLIGLALASRGTFLETRFWPLWLEGPLEYSAKFAARPFAQCRFRGKLLFDVMVQTYLVTLLLVVYPPQEPLARARKLFWCCWAAYGVLKLLLFVSRSHHSNLWRGSVPFVVIVAAALAWTSRRVESRSCSRFVSKFNHSDIHGTFALALILLLLWQRPYFAHYPNLINTWGRPLIFEPMVTDRHIQQQRLAIPSFEENSRTVAQRMAELHERGHSVGVLHTADTVFYLLSALRPPTRYSPLLPNLLTEHQAEREVRRFFFALDYVFVEADATNRLPLAGIYWPMLRSVLERDFRPVLERDYVLEGHIGTLEVWRRRILAAESP
jgi:hypothetical protein